MVEGKVRSGLRIQDRFFPAWKSFLAARQGLLQGAACLPTALAVQVEELVAHPSRAMHFRMMNRVERKAARSVYVVVEPSEELKTVMAQVDAILGKPKPERNEEQDASRARTIRAAMGLGAGRN